MSVVSYLIKRFLRFDKEQPFISISALLAFLGIMIGVMVLIVAMALMNGFDREFREKLFVMNYPLTMQPKFYGSLDDRVLDELRVNFSDLEFSPYLVSAVLSKSGDNLEGGYLFGVDFDYESKVNSVVAKALGDDKPKLFDVVIGENLRQQFFLDRSDKLTYIFTQSEPSGLSLTPKLKRLSIHSSFSSGLHAYDKGYSYTTLESLRRILSIPDGIYDGIHIYSDKPEADIIKLQKFVGDSIVVRGWWEDNANFFAALEMEKVSLFIVLMLIILIASINIISSLLMSVMNRRAEIALLISLGTSKSEIKKLFLLLGVIIGSVGIVCGAILGLIGVWVLDNFEIIKLPADVYPTSTLPVDLSVIDFSMIVVGAFIIVVLSSWYPAKKASEVDLLTVLRNE